MKNVVQIKTISEFTMLADNARNDGNGSLASMMLAQFCFS